MRSSFGKVFMGAASGAGDDEFNRTSFLSHFEGSNNGVNNAFDDGSDSNHTITANGNVTQGSFGPFARPDGEWGVSFDGDGDILKTPSLTIGTGTITYECWLNFTTVAGNTTIVCFNDSDSARVSLYNSDGDLKIYSSANGGRTVKSSAFTTPNSWIKLLLVRASNTATVYLDGASVGTGTMPEDLTGVLAIGAYNGGEIFNGIISNVRLSDNARQSGNYTVETAPLASDSNTDLLTCQSNRFVDNSSNGHTITPSGNAAVTAFGPFLSNAVYDPAVNGASAYFDGTNDDLVAANSTDFDLTSGDFTIAAWVYPDNSSPTGNVEGLITKAVYALPAAGGNKGWQVWWQVLSGTPSLRFLVYTSTSSYPYSSSTFFNGPTFYGNQWTYVTVVRTGDTLKLFLNGVEGLSSSISNFTNSTTTLKIGSSTTWTANNYFSGYMCDVFICKGTAVYTSNFTPPTAPLTAITNTKLLLNMADGQAIDSAAQNNLTLYGTAKLSTGQAKFGDTSILFDGNSDFLTFPHSESNDISGAGNWTVEFFWRFVDNNATQFQEIVSKGVGFQIYGNNGALSIALSASNNTSFFLSATGGTTLSDNTWYHIAAVKNGTAYNVYLNGTNEANLDGTSSSNVETGTDPWFLGATTGSPSYYANGYMDEFRISKFARYTSNFTAPSEPFADKGQ